MSTLSKFILNFFKKNKNKNRHVFYKIVDNIREQDFILQCINKESAFYASLSEIVFDRDILCALHPIQACYIGIEYSKRINGSSLLVSPRINQSEKQSHHFENRYGKYSIKFQDRDGMVCFINQFNDEELFMDARDIALSKEFIEEFDATQAFHIGILAGLKINNPSKNYSILNRNTSVPYLRVVK